MPEQPGDKIGHYQLLQRIGEGGCGIVYMADQAEPVRRRVALKVIKLGMNSDIFARCWAERAVDPDVRIFHRNIRTFFVLYEADADHQ